MQNCTVVIDSSLWTEVCFPCKQQIQQCTHLSDWHCTKNVQEDEGTVSVIFTQKVAVGETLDVRERNKWKLCHHSAIKSGKKEHWIKTGDSRRAFGYRKSKLLQQATRADKTTWKAKKPCYLLLNSFIYTMKKCINKLKKLLSQSPPHPFIHRLSRLHSVTVLPYPVFQSDLSDQLDKTVCKLLLGVLQFTGAFYYHSRSLPRTWIKDGWLSPCCIALTASQQILCFKQEHFLYADCKTKTPFPFQEQLCFLAQEGCLREPSTERFLTPIVFSALALKIQAVQRQDDTAYSKRPVLFLELLQVHIPGHKTEYEFWPVPKISPNPDPIFWSKCVWCPISMCIFGCYFLCMCWFSNRCFLFQDILNEPSFLWRRSHTATAQTHTPTLFTSHRQFGRRARNGCLSPCNIPPVA